MGRVRGLLTGGLLVHGGGDCGAEQSHFGGGLGGRPVVGGGWKDGPVVRGI